MKNTRNYSILAVASSIALAFTLASCSNGGGGGNTSNTPDNNSTKGAVQTIASGEPVGYSGAPYPLTDTAKAKEATDFSYVYGFYFNNESPVPLSYFLSGDSSVKINNSKITINLGDVKPVF